MSPIFQVAYIWIAIYSAWNITKLIYLLLVLYNVIDGRREAARQLGGALVRQSMILGAENDDNDRLHLIPGEKP